MPDESDKSDEFDEFDEPVGGTTAAVTATVSPARRRVGRLVAGALLVLLAAAVAWLILRLTDITAPSAPATTVSHGATPASAPAP